MIKETKKTLYIFIDEAGNFDFTKKGTSHFVLTCVTTFKPELSCPLLRLKYDLFINGPKFGESDYESFHASEDKQIVRNSVFDVIKDMDHVKSYSVIVDKLYSNKIDGELLYARMCNVLIEDVLNDTTNYGKVVVVMDKILFKHKRANITKAIKSTIKKKFNIIPYTFFHQMKSDPNCQIADYCCWVIYVKYTRNELRPLQEISDKVITERIFKLCKDVDMRPPQLSS